MNYLKLGAIFACAYFALSTLTIPLIMLWDLRSNPTTEIAAHSPFHFTIERGNTYTLLLGTTNGETPSPVFADIDFDAKWTNTESKAGLELEKDSGSTQIGTFDKRFGNIKAVSVATLKARASGSVQVSAAGWEGPNHIYVVDHGFLRFIIELFGLAFLNIVLAAIVAWQIYRRLIASGP